MIRIVVVLPAPFGPTNPNSCPGSTVKESRSRATTSPYRRDRSMTSSTPTVVARLAALMSGAYRPPAPKVVVYMAAWRGWSCARAPRRRSRGRSRGSRSRACWPGAGALHPQGDDVGRRALGQLAPREVLADEDRRVARVHDPRVGLHAVGVAVLEELALGDVERMQLGGRAATARSRSAATRPLRARWALSRQSVAARTCVSLSATGRSHEPAQPSTSGFAATAAPGPPQPAEGDRQRAEVRGPPASDGHRHGAVRA